MNSFLETYRFVYDGKEYDLYEIVGQDGIYYDENIGKPIIIKGGINKLCKHFSFVDTDYNINWIQLPPPIGVVCSVIIRVSRPKKDNIEYKFDANEFIGDGEANVINCKGIGTAHMQAMAIKRARSRAVLQELGIDAYGEDEAQEFSERAPYEKTLKTFLANQISTIASQLAAPLEKEALRDLVRQHFNMNPEDKFTVDNLPADGLMKIYNQLYAQYLSENSKAGML